MFRNREKKAIDSTLDQTKRLERDLFGFYFLQKKIKNNCQIKM